MTDDWVILYIRVQVDHLDRAPSRRCYQAKQHVSLTRTRQKCRRSYWIFTYKSLQSRVIIPSAVIIQPRSAFSGPFRPLIPGDSGHPFRCKPATVPEHSGHPPFGLS